MSPGLKKKQLLNKYLLNWPIEVPHTVHFLSARLTLSMINLPTRNTAQDFSWFDWFIPWIISLSQFPWSLKFPRASQRCQIVFPVCPPQTPTIKWWKDLVFWWTYSPSQLSWDREAIMVLWSQETLMTLELIGNPSAIENIAGEEGLMPTHSIS